MGMKKIIGLSFSVLFIGALFVIVTHTDAFAQKGIKWRGGGGWEEGSKYTKMFDANVIETVKGEITEVLLVTPLKGMVPGVGMVLKTNEGVMQVQLGPLWYMERQRMKSSLVKRSR